MRVPKFTGMSVSRREPTIEEAGASSISNQDWMQEDSSQYAEYSDEDDPPLLFNVTLDEEQQKSNLRVATVISAPSDAEALLQQDLGEEWRFRITPFRLNAKHRMFHGENKTSSTTNSTLNTKLHLYRNTHGFHGTRSINDSLAQSDPQDLAIPPKPVSVSFGQSLWFSLGHLSDKYIEPIKELDALDVIQLDFKLTAVDTKSLTSNIKDDVSQYTGKQDRLRIIPSELEPPGFCSTYETGSKKATYRLSCDLDSLLERQVPGTKLEEVKSALGEINNAELEVLSMFTVTARSFERTEHSSLRDSTSPDLPASPSNDQVQAEEEKALDKGFSLDPEGQVRYTDWDSICDSLASEYISP